MRVYVAGQTPRSVAALNNLHRMCEEHLAGRYELEVVDLAANPQLAVADQIVALPTLVRRLPPPAAENHWRPLRQRESTRWHRCCSTGARGTVILSDAQQSNDSDERSPSGEPPFVLRLYIAGQSPRSIRAVNNLRRMVERHLTGEVDLQIIDVYQEAEKASDVNLVAVPMLVKEMPLPVRRLIGDMSNGPKVLAAFGVIADAG